MIAYGCSPHIWIGTDAEQRQAAFVASLEAAVAEGERDGFLTAEEVEAEVQAAIDAVRARPA